MGHQMKAFKDLLSRISADLDCGQMAPRGAAEAVVRHVQQQFNCSRASFWLLEGEADARVMRRVAAHDAQSSPGLVAEPAVLTRDEFADYVDFITKQAVFVCHDAFNDEHLSPMRETYLRPNDIHAVLDATISVNGQPWAILCCAQRGAKRRWLPQEVTLIKRIASEISMRRARRGVRELESTSLAQALEHDRWAGSSI